MTDGSDVSPEVAAAAGGEIWGTLEELLLACAVSRHGTASWDSVATEVQTRSPLAARPRLTPRSCRLRFHHLHRRFSVVEEAAEGQGEAEDLGASAADAWLDELRRLRVAELRREVERCDLSIGTLQSKVELMKEERERSLSGEATTKPEGNVTTGEENVSSEEPGRSCRESNSTDLKRPKRSGSVKAEEGEGEAKQEASGESMAASKESSASLCRRGRKAGGGGEEECEEAASVQQPLAALLDRVAARFGPVFERLQESQESESYRGTIRRHVDLDAMRRKLDDGGSAGYPSSELYRDLLLLCANAAVYVPRHAPEHAAAALDALRLVSAQVSASLRVAPRDDAGAACPQAGAAADRDRHGGRSGGFFFAEGRGSCRHRRPADRQGRQAAHLLPQEELHRQGCCGGGRREEGRGCGEEGRRGCQGGQRRREEGGGRGRGGQGQGVGYEDEEDPRPRQELGQGVGQGRRG